jgi:hypothetical protein
VRFPVFDVLKAIGLPAVPALVRELKEADNSEQLLITRCLVEIYDQGSCEKQLARQRIELESKNANGVQKERLLKVLNHSLWTK